MKNFRLLFTVFALFVSATTFSQNYKISKTDTLFCGKYLLQGVEAVGITAFLKTHPDIRQYATDNLNYDTEWDEESDLIVILKDHIVSVKLSKDIAETKKRIAEKKKNIKRITKETIKIAQDVVDDNKKKK